MPRKRTNKEFLQLMYVTVGEEYTFHSEYVNNSTKIYTTHNLCMYSWDMNPKHFVAGHRCPKCSGKLKKTTTDFIHEVYEIVGNEYMVLGEYINAKTKTLMFHGKCAQEFEISPDHFLHQGIRCGRCTKSRGEQEITKVLNAHNVSFIEQFRVADCRRDRPLPFDFAVFKDDGRLFCLIEFDGLHHYEARSGFGGESNHALILDSDYIKSKYCSENNIRLLRIPYWEMSKTQEILSKEVIQKII